MRTTTLNVPALVAVKHMPGKHDQKKHSGGRNTAQQAQPKVVALKTKEQFNRLTDSLYAKQNIADWQADYVASLPLKGYFGTSQAFEINLHLRNGKALSDRGKVALQTLKDEFDKHAVELPKGLTLWRAVSGDFAKQLLGMGAGASFVDEGYSSTAGIRAATARFGNVRMKMTTGSAMRGIIHRDETEVLFSPGRKFTFVKSYQEGADTIVEVVLQ